MSNQAKTAPACRFTLFDAMALIAATAVGFAVVRAVNHDLTLAGIAANFLARPTSIGPAALIMVRLYLLSCYYVAPCAVIWTPACLFLHLRPEGRLFVKRPGGMACLLATLAIAFAAAVQLLVWIVCTIDQSQALPSLVWSGALAILVTGSAVLACWTTMALGARWCPEPTWLDRLGRVLGATWIAMAVIIWIAIAPKL